MQSRYMRKSAVYRIKTLKLYASGAIVFLKTQTKNFSDWCSWYKLELSKKNILFHGIFIVAWIKQVNIFRRLTDFSGVCKCCLRNFIRRYSENYRQQDRCNNTARQGVI